MSDQTVDATAEEVSAEIVPHEAHPSTLFRTDDPVEVIAQASRAAEALKSVISSQGLVSNIQGREHVRVEGWTTLGAMLGVNPVVVWTRETQDGWEARVEARTLDGRVVGAAEAMCTRAERTWKNRDPFALRSMAQTRATSKALRGPLGFVVTLAGYEATPFEEMPADASSGASTGAPDLSRRANSDSKPTDAQMRKLRSEMTKHKPPQSTLAAMLLSVDASDVTAEDLASGAWASKVSKHQVSGLLDVFASGVLPTGESDIPSDEDEVPSSVAEEAGDLPWSES